MNGLKLTPSHIGLNAHLLSLQANYRSAGISWYIYNLLRHLDESPPAYRYTVFLSEPRFRPTNNLQVRYSAFPTNRPLARIMWEQLCQPIALRRARVDLYHALAFVAPVAMTRPFVTTIYDLSFEHFPAAFKPFNRFYLRTMGRQTARRAAAIIAISESTRRDVIRLWQIEPEKVHTVYSGVDEQFRPLPTAEVAAFKQRQGLPDQFVLFVGTIEPRKNVARLIEAYGLWRSKAKSAPKLFIGGGKGWYYQQVFQLVEKLGLNDQVCFPGYIPQEDLALWYNAATMFVYPSLFEGFGLPVLEAMACGTPTITSCVSSLPEVAGEAALLVDPTDSEALSETMCQVFDQVELQQAMIGRGLRQSAGFRWQKTAAETTRIYERLLA